MKIAGSGALGDIGTHVVDFSRYLVGEITDVNAMTKTWIPERPIQTGGIDKLGTVKTGGNDVPKAAVDVDDEFITRLSLIMVPLERLKQHVMHGAATTS
ncbi:hypothetical protein V7157_15970 [Neobacillus drentensis]|uniref:Gfo/Idh/MocA family protein n=1 Tax=Neobacillus drentensis TaxID=220684 RepID=UPI003001FE1A